MNCSRKILKGIISRIPAGYVRYRIIGFQGKLTELKTKKQCHPALLKKNEDEIKSLNIEEMKRTIKQSKFNLFKTGKFKKPLAETVQITHVIEASTDDSICSIW